MNSRTTCCAFLVLAFAGCGWVPRGQFTTVETQNRVLSEQNRAQQAEIANLREHQRRLEDQLIRTGRTSTTTDPLVSR